MASVAFQEFIKPCAADYGYLSPSVRASIAASLSGLTPNDLKLPLPLPLSAPACTMGGFHYDAYVSVCVRVSSTSPFMVAALTNTPAASFLSSSAVTPSVCPERPGRPCGTRTKEAHGSLVPLRKKPGPCHPESAQAAQLAGTSGTCGCPRAERPGSTFPVHQHLPATPVNYCSSLADVGRRSMYIPRLSGTSKSASLTLT